MGLEYNGEERQLLSVFHQFRNDLNIYTEDCDKDKAFYEILFKRLLHGTGVQVSDIFPIGSCGDVETAWMNHQDPCGFYVVDGDIYVIYAPKFSCKNLFVLDSYCIENFVIDANSVSKTAYHLNGAMEDLVQVTGKINFELAFDSILQPIMDLFFVMSLERKYCNIHELKEYDRFVKKGGIFDVDKVESEMETIKNRLVPHVISSKEYLADLQMLRNLYPYTYDNFLKIISGKDYILPYLRRYICRQMNYKFQIPNESWKYHFAQYCDLDRLEPLKNAIIDRVNTISSRNASLNRINGNNI